MATGDYTTLALLKSRVRKTATDEDTLLSALITAASRQIDADCQRRFWVAQETRLYSAAESSPYGAPSAPYPFSYPYPYPYSFSDGVVVDVDDFTSIVTLKTDDDGDRVFETTWTAGSDYFLEPANAQVSATDPRPYTRIRVDLHNNVSRRRFPLRPQSIQLIANFGWVASDGVSAPPPVQEACLRLAERLYKLRDAPLGIMQSTATPIDGGFRATMVRVAQDMDIQALLANFKRDWVFA